MPSIAVLFSTILSGCAPKEPTEPEEPQPVSYELECTISDSCYGGYSDLELSDEEFASYLNDNNQLTEQQCINICLDTYYYDDLCGCHGRSGKNILQASTRVLVIVLTDSRNGDNP